MDERHERYLEDLRARHAADREALRMALAGRRPRLLREMARRHKAIERETEKALSGRGVRA